MKEIHAPSGTRSRPALTRDPALDTRTHTPRSKIRAPHTRTPHHATLGHYFRIHSARIRAHYTWTLELHYTRTPLPDTPELRIRAPVPCAPKLHYFTVCAPDSCSLKDEHATNHGPSSGFVPSSCYFHCSSSSSRTTVHTQKFERCSQKSCSIPSATTQKHPNSLSSHLSADKSTFHLFSQSLDLHSQLTQIPLSNQISTLQSSDVVVAVLVVAGPRPKQGRNENDGAD